LLIINDGSTDDSDAIIRSIEDYRIRYISRENRGLAATLNQLIDESRGELIARMDADDISQPRRLEKQVKIFDNRSIVLVGANVCYIDSEGEKLGYSVSASSDKAVQYLMRKGNVIFHPTVIFRKDECVKVGGYSKVVSKYVEDYLLWVELLNYGKVHVMPEALLDYRVHAQAISANSYKGLPLLLEKIQVNKGHYANLATDFDKLVKSPQVSSERSNGYNLPYYFRRIIIFFKDLIYGYGSKS
jgi:glycosyltransferase involved in cell wall biosynthesis